MERILALERAAWISEAGITRTVVGRDIRAQHVRAAEHEQYCENPKQTAHAPLL